jgi:hypothetical protein
VRYRIRHHRYCLGAAALGGFWPIFTCLVFAQAAGAFGPIGEGSLFSSWLYQFCFWEGKAKALVILHLPFFITPWFVTENWLKSSTYRHLTEFYLWIAVGGVLGGLFNALVAPLAFKKVVEYPLAIVLACLLRPCLVDDRRHSRLFDFGLPLALGLALFVVVRGFYIHNETAGLLVTISCLTAMLCYSFATRPLRFGLGVAVIMLGGIVAAVVDSGLIPRAVSLAFCR